jgi:hypothetical protein
MDFAETVCAPTRLLRDISGASVNLCVSLPDTRAPDATRRHGQKQIPTHAPNISAFPIRTRTKSKMHHALSPQLAVRALPSAAALPCCWGGWLICHPIAKSWHATVFGGPAYDMVGRALWPRIDPPHHALPGGPIRGHILQIHLPPL